MSITARFWTAGSERKTTGGLSIRGERRITVSKAEASLRDCGIIAYSRDRVRVLDRPRLKAAACPCYLVIRTVYDRMLAASWRDAAPCRMVIWLTWLTYAAPFAQGVKHVGISAVRRR